MEPRFGHDLGRVRIHTDSQAAESARSIHASAYTVGNHVVFGEGRYDPHSLSGQKLLAHELSHAQQQGFSRTPGPLRIGDPRDPQESSAGEAEQSLGERKGGAAGTAYKEPSLVRRKVELRPPGKGEASAFDRAKELVDRLNGLSPSIQYELKGQDLTYSLKDPDKLSHFDKTMKGFIDRAETVPMRLINSKGLLGGQTVLVDDFGLGYVDLDDLMADDDVSFQSDMVHFLTERFNVKGYARRIGTAFSEEEFARAHRAGLDAEAALLQDMFKDPTISFLYEEGKPDGTVVFAFKSRKEGYRVFHAILRSQRAVAGGKMWVQKKDGTRVSMRDFQKERAATAAPARP